MAILEEVMLCLDLLLLIVPWQTSSEQEEAIEMELVSSFDISSLDASVTLIYPSLASCPHTAAAASVVIATALL